VCVCVCGEVPGSPPVNVRGRPVSASTVVVQWEEPLHPHGVVKVCIAAMLLLALLYILCVSLPLNQL